MTILLEAMGVDFTPEIYEEIILLSLSITALAVSDPTSHPAVIIHPSIEKEIMNILY
ncbi:MAG: hypothetical protein LLG40_12325 [Deltaproteobacteria bacterium]|nr:hypothetical protein [Deltaproteobacteria bacterium]